MRRLAVCLASCCFGLSLLASAKADDTPVKWERIKLEEIFRAEGVTAADINKDGRMDLINGEAWYEQPADAKAFKSGDWKKHPMRADGLKDFKADGGYRLAGHHRRRRTGRPLPLVREPAGQGRTVG